MKVDSIVKGYSFLKTKIASRWRAVFFVIKKRKKFAIAMALLLLFAIGVPIYISSNKASAAWWNESWMYRKSIQITNNTTAESNVYANLTLDTSDSTKFQGDCGDLRFTNASGNLLQYYVVSGCATASTSLHVNFNSFPAGAQAIYYYYGNPTASDGFSASDFSTEASNYTVGATGTEEKSPGPVAHWKFDEGSGNIAYNSSSQGSLNGTVSSNTSWKQDTDCVSGKCLDFLGTGSPNVSVVDNDSLDFGTESFTVEMWGNYRDFTYPKAWFMAKKSAACFSGAGNPGWDIGHSYNSNGINICFNDGINFTGNLTATFDSGYRPTDLKNKWAHLSVVFDRSAGRIKYYVNGVKQSNETNITSITGSVNNASALSIGAMYGWQTDGRIDDVKIFRYIRTPSQIASDYNNGVAGIGSSEGSSVAMGDNSDKWMSDGLIAHWRMDEASWNGTVGEIKDASGSNNNGQSVSGANTGAGKFGNSGIFDGVSNFAKTAVTGARTNVVSVSAWIKPSSTMTSRQDFLASGNSAAYSSNNWIFSIKGNTGVDAGLSVLGYAPSGGSNLSTAGAVLVQNSWNHVAFTSDGSTVKIYVNGVLSTSGQIAINANNTLGEFIGASSTNGTSPSRIYSGAIDETRIYSRVLSPQEVSSLYDYAPGPLAYWSLDENSGTSINDKSGNNVAGSLGTGNGTPNWSEGKSGSGLTFGSGKYGKVALGSLAGVFGTNVSGRSFSYSMWFKSNNVSTTQYLLTNNSPCNNPGSFSIRLTGGNVGFSYYGTVGGTASHSFTPSASLQNNQWYHLEWVKTFGQLGVKAYLNGIEQTVSGDSANLANGGLTNVVLGAFNGDGVSCTAGVDEPTPVVSNSLNGSLDEVKIYNYARTPKQVLEDMNMGGSANKDPFGYWKMEEGTGTVVKNFGTRGTAINGTMSSMASPATATSGWTSNGKIGKALNFDGVDDYVNVGVGTNFFPLNTFSMCSWIKTPGLAPGMTTNGIMSITYGLGMFLNASGQLVSRMDDGTNLVSITAGNSLHDNAWHHVCLAYDGMNRHMYIDGTKKNTTATTWLGTTRWPTNTVSVGHENNNPPFYKFNGSIDEVKVYGYALSDSDVAAEYANGGESVTMASAGISAGSGDNSAKAEYCIPGDSSTCNAPVAEWKFDEKQGTSVSDSSSKGNTGTLSGNPVWTQGKIGSAVKFDGADDYMSISYVPQYDIRNAITLSVWIKRTTDFNQLQDEFILSRPPSWYFYDSYNSGNIRGDVYIDGVRRAGLNASVPFDGKWYQITYTYDSSTHISKIYRNGSLVDSTTLTGLNNYLIDSSTANFVNMGQHTLGRGMILDNARIYDYARTPAQIAYDYNRGGPVGWWKMDECQGNVANDSSGNGNNGTITVGAAGTQTSAGTCTTTSTAWGNGATGKFNSALNFDGTDDYGDVDLRGLGLTKSQTLSAWVKTSGPPGGQPHQTVLATDPAHQYGVKLMNYKNSARVGLWLGSGTANYEAFVSKDVNDGQWHFISGSYDYDAGAVSIFIDGVSYAPINSGQMLINVGSAGKIGRDYHSIGNNYSFNGQIDDVRIYNYALTKEQIANIMNEGAALRFGPSVGSP